MAFTSVIQIIKLNELRKGVKDGRPWEMQDAECLLLDEEGKPSQVGVLMLPKELRGNVTAGIYAGTFALSASLRDRRIEAILTNLTPYEVRRVPPAQSAPAAATPPKA